MPLATLLVLAFSRMEWEETKQSGKYAKNVFVSIVVSLFFLF